MYTRTTRVVQREPPSDHQHVPPPSGAARIACPPLTRSCFTSAARKLGRSSPSSKRMWYVFVSASKPGAVTVPGYQRPLLNLPRTSVPTGKGAVPLPKLAAPKLKPPAGLGGPGEKKFRPPKCVAAGAVGGAAPNAGAAPNMGAAAPNAGAFAAAPNAGLTAPNAGAAAGAAGRKFNIPGSAQVLAIAGRALPNAGVTEPNAGRLAPSEGQRCSLDSIHATQPSTVEQCSTEMKCEKKRVEEE